jgi:hypothetical protein
MPEVPKIDTAETIHDDYWNFMEEIRKRIQTLPMYEAELLQDMMYKTILEEKKKHPEVTQLIKSLF